MIKTLLLICGCLFVGCKTVSHHWMSDEDYVRLMDQAKTSLENGEYYRAREQVGEILENNSEDFEAQQLMAEILDQEIASHKAVLEDKLPEDYTRKERSSEAKTWLERSQTLLSINQYEEALLAAEKVFMYDPQNAKASRLVDEIRGKIIAEGKADSVFLNKVAVEETEERTQIYKEQAKEWMKQEKWGAVRLALEKALLLSPQDAEAIRMYEILKSQKKLDAA